MTVPLSTTTAAPSSATGELDKLDPATGAVLAADHSRPMASTMRASPISTASSTRRTSSPARSISSTPNSLSYESTISSVGGLSGLAGDPDRNVLWGAAQEYRRHGHTLRDRSRHRQRAQSGPAQRCGLRAGPRLRQWAVDRLRHRRLRGRQQLPRLLRSRHSLDAPAAPAGRCPGLRLRPGRRRPWRSQHRLVPVQRERRRQPGAHHHHARRVERQRLAVHQRPEADDQPVRRGRQPGRVGHGQRRRRPQRRHRLDGALLGQLSRPDPGRDQGQPGRVHDRHPGRHGRPVPVHGDLDQSGRRLGHQLPADDHDGVGQRQHPVVVREPQRFDDRRSERDRRDRDRQHTTSRSRCRHSPTACTASRSAAWSISTASP